MAIDLPVVGLSVSSDVVVGNPTKALDYNFLRNDVRRSLVGYDEGTTAALSAGMLLRNHAAYDTSLDEIKFRWSGSATPKSMAAFECEINSTQFVHTGVGPHTFGGVVTGVAPTADLHLATKKYVDDTFGGGGADHGGLAGLGDDDHSQYILVTGTRAFTGDVKIAATDKLFLDGGIDTYIYESAGNILKSVAGGSAMFQLNFPGTKVEVLTGFDFAVQAADKFYLDGGSNTYFIESSADTVRLFTGGSEAWRIDTSRNMIINPAARFYLDAGGDTYMLEFAPDDFRLIVGGGEKFKVTTTFFEFGDQEVRVRQAQKLFFDGGSNTYIHENVGDELTFVVGGVEMLKLAEAGVDRVKVLNSHLQIDALQNLYLDGGSDTYITESSDDVLDFVVGGDIRLRLFELPNSTFIADHGTQGMELGGIGNGGVLRLSNLGNIGADERIGLLEFVSLDAQNTSSNLVGTVGIFADTAFASVHPEGKFIIALADGTQASRDVFQILKTGNVSILGGRLIFPAAAGVGEVVLQNTDESVSGGDLLGRISAIAPNEGSGGDALLEAAAIEFVATANFVSTSNATAIVFKTGLSEAATERMRINSAGVIIQTLASSPIQLVNQTEAILNTAVLLDYRMYHSTPGTAVVAGNIGFGAEGTWSPTSGTRDSYFTIRPVLDGSAIERMRVTSVGHIAIGAAAKIFLDGVVGTGDTYIREVSSNVMEFTAGNVVQLKLLTASVQMPNGKLFINETVNTFMTRGITIQQGGDDDEILTLKNSDVNHLMSSIAEVDSFGTFKKLEAVQGGLSINGFAEGGTAGLSLTGRNGTPQTTKSTSGLGVIRITVGKRSGGGATSIGGDRNMVSFEDFGTTRFILDADGDSHQDVGTEWTNFDVEDDIAVLDSIAVELHRPDDPTKLKIRAMEALQPLGRDWLQSHKLVTFNDDGHHFVNRSQMQNLLIGAVRQVGRQQSELWGEFTGQIAILTAQIEKLQGEMNLLT